MEKTPSQYEHTRATGQDSKPTTRCLKTQVSAAKKDQCTTRQSSWQWNFGPQNYRTNGNYQQGINVTTAKAQLNNQVGYAPLGHKL